MPTDTLRLALVQANVSHEFALMDMEFSNTDAFLCRKQAGYTHCRYVFFPGCQTSAIAPDTVYKAYADLTKRLTGGVALLLGCCGAIAKWAGRELMYAETVRMLNEHFAILGHPVIIAGCPMCADMLSKHSHDMTLREISDQYDMLMDRGGPFNIQLSGGEPTLRDDLPEIIQLGRKKGFTFFQLNTNGIRLAEEKEYAHGRLILMRLSVPPSMYLTTLL